MRVHVFCPRGTSRVVCRVSLSQCDGPFGKRTLGDTVQVQHMTGPLKSGFFHFNCGPWHHAWVEINGELQVHWCAASATDCIASVGASVGVEERQGDDMGQLSWATPGQQGWIGNSDGWGGIKVHRSDTTRLRPTVEAIIGIARLVKAGKQYSALPAGMGFNCQDVTQRLFDALIAYK